MILTDTTLLEFRSSNGAGEWYCTDTINMSPLHAVKTEVIALEVNVSFPSFCFSNRLVRGKS
jgi:hypothetical protein